MSKKFNEFSPDQQSELTKDIATSWTMLYNLRKEVWERTYRYLFFSNAGGAVATLSFIGASNIALELRGTIIALIAFVAGIILVGLGIYTNSWFLFETYQLFHKKMDRFYNNKITLEQLYENDKNKNMLTAIVHCGAFFCFMAGCLSGAFALFK